MIREIRGERRTIPGDLALKSNATDRVDTLSVKSLSLNKRDFVAIGSLLITSLGNMSTAIAESHYEPIPIKEMDDQTSILSDLASIYNKFERHVFSYPAKIIDIENTSAGDPRSVTLLVSVEGKDIVYKCPAQQFHFETKPNMQVMVDGVERGGVRQLVFRTVSPLLFDEEEEQLIAKVVSAFGSL